MSVCLLHFTASLIDSVLLLQPVFSCFVAAFSAYIRETTIDCWQEKGDEEEMQQKSMVRTEPRRLRQSSQHLKPLGHQDALKMDDI